MKNIKSLISLASVVFHCIIILLVVTILGNKIVINKANIEDRNKFNDTVNNNYIVYGLSEKQQEEFKTLEYIDYVYSYYLYETNVSVKNNTYKNSIYIYSDADYSKTPFADSRLIENTQTNNKVYIDYYYASLYDLSLNSEITLYLDNNAYKLNVAGIYETNYLEDVHVMINYNDYTDILDKIFIKSKTNNSYIHTTNSTDFEAYLHENYIPEAFMLVRDDFDSDIDYQIYLESYKSKNYYNNYNVQALSNMNLDTYTSNVSKYNKISVICIIISVLIVDTLVSIIYKRKLKVISVNTDDYKTYSRIHLLSMILSIVIGGILICIIPNNYTSSSVKLNLMKSIGCLSFIIISYIISVIVGCGIKYITTFKTIKGDKNKE